MNNLVSIIVTSYNHAEYLDQRMESLLNQTYDRLEIIVIDDCSSDDSRNVLAKYGHYSHIQIINLEENRGYANASNLGVSMCRGEYIMFAECDDYNKPEHIETLMECMGKSEYIGVAYCRSNMVDSSGTISGTDFQYRENSFKDRCAHDTLIPKGEMQKYLLISCVIPNMSAALIRKKYFELVGGISTNYRTCADWDLWCRIARSCDFYYITSPLNYFRTHPTTVRSTFGIFLPLSEMFSLLYDALSNTPLSFPERLRFRVNLGFIWANYINSNPAQWIRDFLPIWRISIKYDKMSILFVLLGFCRKMFYGSRRTFRLMVNCFGNKDIVNGNV